MMENTMQKIQIMLNNETTEVCVRRNVPYKVQVGCVKSAADAIVENGEYMPWVYEIHFALFVLTQYTNFQIPSDWGDNELMDFVSHNYGYQKIIAAIDGDELAHADEWLTQLVEYRKQYAIHNGFERILGKVNQFAETLLRASEENPEALEMMAGMLVDKLNSLKEKLG